MSIEGYLLEEEKLVGNSRIELAYIQSLQFRQNIQLLWLQGASMFQSEEVANFSIII